MLMSIISTILSTFSPTNIMNSSDWYLKTLKVILSSMLTMF